jgi:hypothetical protein
MSIILIIICQRLSIFNVLSHTLVYKYILISIFINRKVSKYININVSKDIYTGPAKYFF